jgi:FAD/FMN-containing dehydrogenase
VPDPLTPLCLDWIAEFAEALAPYVNGAYTNVPNADMADWETAYWGEGVDRLRAIKAKYDPNNVFSFEQSIPLLHDRRR